MISKKERIAILQILAIKEDLTSLEFSNVLNEIGRISVNSIFSNSFDKEKTSSINNIRNPGKTQPKNSNEILQKLKLSDPEKFQMLYELKLSIRSGTVLKSINDLKDFLARIDQLSLVSNSKSKTVENMLMYLSKKNSAELRDIIKNKIRPTVNSDDKGFNELANYIIDPKKQ